MYGELVKLQIYGYSKEDGSEDSIIDDVFSVQINPNQFKRSYRISYTPDNSQGQRGNRAQYARVEPEQLNIEFIIDGTGVVQNDMEIGAGIMGTASAIADTFTEQEDNMYVINQIDHLQGVMYGFQGEVHRTPFVGVYWGSEWFEGVLLSMDVTYTLFQPSGIPLRAKVDLSLREQVPQPRQESATQTSSPDLTHVRVVNESDNILLMTNKIYEDPKYYLEVAKANKLTNFRKLKTGNKLVFPPFKKTS